MKVITIKKAPNKDAIEMLEEAIEKVKSGEIKAVAVSWVGSDGSISGDISKGDNNIEMWASLEHSAREFYLNNILEKTKRS